MKDDLIATTASMDMDVVVDGDMGVATCMEALLERMVKRGDLVKKCDVSDTKPLFTLSQGGIPLVFIHMPKCKAFTQITCTFLCHSWGPGDSDEESD